MRTALWGAAAILLSVTPVSAQTCRELWYQRNEIFKAAGYCFRTPQGIAAFGNAGCLYDDEADVPLSENARRRVAALRAQERRQGCR
jgi:hypothetical protein